MTSELISSRWTSGGRARHGRSLVSALRARKAASALRRLAEAALARGPDREMFRDCLGPVPPAAATVLPPPWVGRECETVGTAGGRTEHRRSSGQEPSRTCRHLGRVAIRRRPVDPREGAQFPEGQFLREPLHPLRAAARRTTSTISPVK